MDSAQELATKLQPLYEHLQKLDAQRDQVMADIGAILEGAETIGAQAKRALKAFGIHWQMRYGQTFVPDYAKMIPMIKRILKTGVTLEDFDAAAKRFVNTEDRWLESKRHELGILVAQINQYRPMRRPGPALPIEDRPVGCSHEPACASPADCTALKRRSMAAR